MCGIVGCINFDGSGVNQIEISKGLRTLSHRGPDAHSTWCHENVAFGHHRLSIIDTSETANQPMSDGFGRTIVFNGEIYNFKELRKQLERHYTFRTNSDTEVILAAYNEWGEDCVTRFNGDWAFAIFDQPKNEIFLSRDRFGIKPLYYYLSGSRLIFSSEMKALFAMRAPARMTGETLLMLIKSARNEMGPETIYQGIHALPAAHNMTISTRGKIALSEYWGEHDLFENSSPPSSIEEATERFGELLGDSIRLRMHADVPVGLALSGGLDSSLICALANTVNNAPINTFSGVARGYASDESPFSHAVAKELRSVHTEIELGSSDFFNAIEKYVYAQEALAATFNPIARFFVLEKAAESVKVILDGQGGDELLCGYLRFNKIYNKAFKGDLEEKKPIPPNIDFPALSELNKEIGSGVKPRLPFTPKPERETDPVTIAQYQALRGSGLLSLLHTEDHLTMAHSIEGRVPFLDHRLVEFCFRCPLEMKIGDTTKILIRKLAEAKQLLPDAVISRVDKKGFASPYAEKLVRDENFKAQFKEYLFEACQLQRDIFDMHSLGGLMEQHFEGEEDNANRLIRSVTLASLLTQFNVSIA